MKKIILSIALISITIASFLFIFNLLSAPSKNEKVEIIIFDNNDIDSIALKLQENGFIKSFLAFNILYSLKGSPKIDEGGYYLTKNMNAWKIVNELNKGADLKQVIIPEGLRKEQIGEMIGSKLNWTNEETKNWNLVYTKMKPEYEEGVYFPDTYLIPVDEKSTLVAARMINNFNEKFAPYQMESEEKNIKWTTVLKIASLIEREAAGPHDMALISGVIWNRLNNNQKLDIDATIQYAKGKTDGKWWSKVTGFDIKNIDSPYNTYKYKGLPPTPIANPGLISIKAALNPEKTECLFYLHSSGQIYCSKTYEEHLENIEKYLN